MNSKGKYRDCQKSTGDKTWDVSEAYEIGHWDSIIEIISVLCDVVKSSSKPYIVVHSHKAALLPSLSQHLIN